MSKLTVCETRNRGYLRGHGDGLAQIDHVLLYRADPARHVNPRRMGPTGPVGSRGICRRRGRQEPRSIEAPGAGGHKASTFLRSERPAVLQSLSPSPKNNNKRTCAATLSTATGEAVSIKNKLHKAMLIGAIGTALLGAPIMNPREIEDLLRRVIVPKDAQTLRQDSDSSDGAS